MHRDVIITIAVFVVIAVSVAEAAPTKPATEVLLLSDDAVSITDANPSVYQGIHVGLTPRGFGEIAEAAGMPVAEVWREGFGFWTFSDDPEEDYVSPALPEPIRTPRTLGSAVGPWAAHAYKKAGRHTLRLQYNVGSFEFDFSATINVQAIGWVKRKVGVCSAEPAALAARVPDELPGAVVSEQYSDPAAALAALSAGTIDALVFQGGEEFAYQAAPRSPGLPDDSIVWTIGSGRAVLRPQFDDGSTAARLGYTSLYPIYVADSDQLAEEGQTDFATTEDLTGKKIAVYVNGARIPPADYTVTPNAIRFTVGRSAGNRVVAIRLRTNGQIHGASYGYSPISIRGSSFIIKGIEIRSDYDPANPSMFELDDLKTWDTNVHTNGFGIGSSSGAPHDVTLFDCGAFGVQDGIVTSRNALKGLYLVGVEIENYHRYAIWGSRARLFSAVGCRIEQPADTVNVAGDRGYGTANLPGVPNRVEQGSYRSGGDEQTLFNRSVLTTRGSWAGRGVDQPIFRFCSSQKPGQSWAVTESLLTGGATMVTTNMGGTGVHPQHGHRFFGHNWVQMARSDHALTSRGGTSRGNVYVVFGDDRGRDLSVFGGGQKTLPYARSIDLAVSGVYSVRDTFAIMGSRRDRALTIANRFQIGWPGIRLLCSNGPVALKEDAPSVKVLIRRPRRGWRNRSRFRVWTGATEKTATSFESASAQAAVYNVAPALAEDHSGGPVTISRVDGEDIPAGTTFWLSATATPYEIGYVMEANGALRAATPADDAFPVDNRQVWIPEATLVDPLILIAEPEAWSEVRIRETDTALAFPAETDAYLPATWEPLDKTMGLRPLAGSPALGAGTPNTAWRDFRGAPRPQPGSLGALETQTVLPDESPLYSPPGAPTVSWANTRFGVGDTISNGIHLEVMMPQVRGNPPLPSLTASDARIQLERGKKTTLETSVTIQPGDRLTPVLEWSHVTIGWRRATGVPTQK